MSLHPFLRHGRSQGTSWRPWLIFLDMRSRVNEMEKNTPLMDLFGQRCVFNFFSSSIACKNHMPTITRIKIHGEAPQAMQRATLMFTALMRTIPALFVAVAFNSTAMVLIHASGLMKIFSKAASALSQTQKQCESYGIMSLMRILVKLVKQGILSTGTRQFFFFGSNDI
jgi:hypothetical protein